MANELSVVASISASKGGASINSVGSSGSATTQFDLPSGSDNMQMLTQEIGTSDEALTISADISSALGLLFVKNLDATNYVELSFDTGGSFAGDVFEKLIPGATYIGHPPTATIYAKANTAACVLLVGATETIE